ncbi:fimbrial biogenesis chaperone [Hyalangium gracile]|uniref:fimbrial biogenesis chaperone n=1 Tax=Hyalangium gracile TaxID=394092 RepID=UPI001CCC048E|nr:fimbria/pilus periplasmic chaperone [Hyalangium gracile]
MSLKNPNAPWWTRLLLATTVGMVPAGSALAADFQVNPVRIDLNDKTRTALLAVQNSSAESLRLQVSLYEWTQDAQGRVELSPTRDLTHFPSLLMVEPGQSRNIRVGGQLTAGDEEKTYRIIVEQLPTNKPPSSAGTQIHVLTRMSIPLFFAPAKSAPQGRVEGLALQDGAVSFSLRNTGNTHVFAKKAYVKGRDAEGRTVLDQAQVGWYVLAGDERQFSLQVPGELCHRLRELSVKVETDSGTFPATAALSGNHCGR